MITLVKDLADYARRLKPNAAVGVNLGGRPDLLTNPSLFSSVDLVMREEVWYGEGAPVEPGEPVKVLQWLRYAKELGKVVIVVEYARDMRSI